MATSIINETTICNSALVKIGDKLILSTTDEVKAARLCAARIDFVRDIILTSYPWKNSLRREILAPDVETPVFQYDKQFTTPVNMLRLWLVTNDGGTPLEEFEQWEHEGGKILTNEDTLFIIYGQRLDDYIGVTQLMAETMAFYLAWDISYPITQDKNVRADLKVDFRDMARKAASVDAKQGPLRTLDATDWINSRVGPSGFDFSVFRFITP